MDTHDAGTDRTDHVRFTTVDGVRYDEERPRPAPVPLQWILAVLLGAAGLASSAWATGLWLLGDPRGYGTLAWVCTGISLIGLEFMLELILRVYPRRYYGTQHVEAGALGWSLTVLAAGACGPAAAWFAQAPDTLLPTHYLTALPFVLAPVLGTASAVTTVRRLREGDRVRAQHTKPRQVPGTLVSVTPSDELFDGEQYYDVVVRYEVAGSVQEAEATMLAYRAKAPSPGAPLQVTYDPGFGSRRPLTIVLADTADDQPDQVSRP